MAGYFYSSDLSKIWNAICVMKNDEIIFWSKNLQFPNYFRPMLFLSSANLCWPLLLLHHDETHNANARSRHPYRVLKNFHYTEAFVEYNFRLHPPIYQLNCQLNFWQMCHLLEVLTKLHLIKCPILKTLFCSL